MRLQQYYKYWQTVYESNIESKIDEVLDLTTKVKRKGNEWQFWIGSDLYTVKTLPKGNNGYSISFAYTDLLDNSISSITDKHTPFSVMDGVAVVMKNLVELESPKSIEYIVVNSKKKVDVFKRITEYIMNKHKNIFDDYKLNMENVNIGDMFTGVIPDEIKDIKGIRFQLRRI